MKKPRVRKDAGLFLWPDFRSPLPIRNSAVDALKKSMRMELAKRTVEIVDRGHYESFGGRSVDISERVSACLTATRYFAPDDLKRLRSETITASTPPFVTAFEVVNETTLKGIERLQPCGSIAALNFASARNPGGGFLNGSEAQEESLARSSALYASLQRAWIFYERHRESPSLLYSDAMILSPDCPIIRDDTGALRDVPQTATFIMSPAPNAGATSDRGREELKHLPDVLRRRSDYVLALAAAQGCRNLVLGAWGCGVFHNDPHLVAKTFADHLRHGMWAGRFERVVFSVLDTSQIQKTYDAFEEAFAG